MFFYSCYVNSLYGHKGPIVQKSLFATTQGSHNLLLKLYRYVRILTCLDGTNISLRSKLIRVLKSFIDILP